MVVDGFSQKEGSYYSSNYSLEGGGMAATAMCAAAKLGSRTRMLSRIGDDVNGSFIKRGLEDFGIDTSCMMTLENTCSATSFILIEGNTGEKQFWSEKEHQSYRKPVKLDTALLTGTDVLLVDGYWMEAAQDAVIWASENNVPVVADFKEKMIGLDKLLPYIDYLIIPDFFAESLTNKKDMIEVLPALKQMIKGIPVITQSKNGGAYLWNDRVCRYNVFLINCIDSTGAGDAFHGAFCHFLTKNLPLDECLNMSSMVGAMNCRCLGGRKGLPSETELAEYYEMVWNNPLIMTK